MQLYFGARLAILAKTALTGHPVRNGIGVSEAFVIHHPDLVWSPSPYGFQMIQNIEVDTETDN